MSDPATPTPEPTVPTTPTPEPAPPPAPEPAPEPASSVLDAPPAFDATKLTLPEGIDAEGEPFVEFKGIATELGITNEVAQRLIDFHHKHQAAAGEKLATDWQATQDQWVATVKADKEIGNLDQMRQTISKVADNAELTDPEFKQALALTGAGNHPAVLRTLFRWAKALGEGGSVQGGVPARNANGSLANQQPSLAEAIYGPSGPHSGGPRLS